MIVLAFLGLALAAPQSHDLCVWLSRDFLRSHYIPICIYTERYFAAYLADRKVECLTDLRVLLLEGACDPVAFDLRAICLLLTYVYPIQMIAQPSIQPPEHESRKRQRSAEIVTEPVEKQRAESERHNENQERLIALKEYIASELRGSQGILSDDIQDRILDRMKAVNVRPGSVQSLKSMFSHYRLKCDKEIARLVFELPGSYPSNRDLEVDIDSVDWTQILVNDNDFFN